MQSKKLLLVANNEFSFLIRRMHLAHTAKNQGYEVHVAFPKEKDYQIILDNGFIFHDIKLDRSGTNPLKELTTINSLRKLYKEISPDVVHHFSIKPIIYGGIAAKLNKTPRIIFTFTGLGYVFTNNTFKIKILRKFIAGFYKRVLKQKNSATIFLNTDDHDFFINQKLISKDRANLIKSSGVDVQKYSPCTEPQGEIKILFPARLLKDKGIYEFIDAIKIIKSQKFPVKFMIVGFFDKDNPAAITQNEFDNWQKEELFEWLGFQSNMLEVYKQANIICLPSYREGVPNTLLESGACQRAIVTTDVPGCREVVKHGYNGFLVPVKNSKALADALIKLICDEKLRKQFAENSRKHIVENFAIEKICERILELYGVRN